MYSLGIDIGGTGCKCVAFTDDGVERAKAYKEYGLPSGSATLPPKTLADSVFFVLEECIKKIDAQKVCAITVASFGESFVAIDRDGQSVGDILLYFGNHDTSAFDRLIDGIGKDKFVRIAKLLPDPSFSLANMLYTKEIAEKPVWKFLFIASYITYLLSGETTTDVSLACRSLLLDVEKRDWSDELLSATGILRDELPDVAPTGSVIGKILPSLAKTLGLNPDTLIVVGGHDQIVNALGAGVLNPSDAVDTSGTCECVAPFFASMPENAEFQENHFACVPYLDTDGYVTYAYNVSAGSVVRWYRDCFEHALSQRAREAGKSLYAYMDDTCPDEPSSLIVLPFLQGMGGTPDVDAAATGLVAGLTTSTRLPDIYRATLEGITLEMRYNQEKLHDGGIKIDRLFACGGGAKSAPWLQIKADVLGVEIIPVLADETGAMGSAILGFAASKKKSIFDVAKPFLRYGKPYQPNEKNKALYDKKYEKYCALRKLYGDLR